MSTDHLEAAREVGIARWARAQGVGEEAGRVMYALNECDTIPREMVARACRVFADDGAPLTERLERVGAFFAEGRASGWVLARVCRELLREGGDTAAIMREIAEAWS